MKYNSNPIFYLVDKGITVTKKSEVKGNYLYFPSTFEYQVYKTLLELDTPIVNQYPIDLKFTYWKVDFKLPSYDTLVEAKGFETEAYKLKLKAFRYYYPDARLEIVKNLSQARELVSRLKQRQVYSQSTK
ncbi:hypothetical protein [Synechococcus sp. PCC 6312]|uniref:hypothetical protein n=1 Tax=Synechococcus sp. (strain ATCC 27167 / PCC 6312) TaxID=195253 RepID=UPI00029EE2BB|nr:hypothetical protein [Synechococcus sp. PCC 6312]AFY60536.1 hypothetical protein Syn6312_1365 [Synechococcus sp. PCC 6312]